MWERNRKGRIVGALFAVIATAGVIGGMGGSPAVAADELFAVSFGESCASTPDGEMWCWGESWDGNLANGTGGGPFSAESIESSPVQASISGVVQTSGRCALLDDGDVRCWGSAGEIENGEGSFFTDPPWGVTLPTDYGFDQAAQVAGRCARLVDGGVQCYGWDNWGQLGVGGTGWAGAGYPAPPPSSSTAVDVVGLDDVVDIAGGDLRTYCAAKSDGTVWCWGLNQDGQVGNGQSGNDSFPCQMGNTCTDWRYVSTPSKVLGITDAVGVEGTCALRQGGKVSCWGLNKGGRFDPTAPVTTMFAPIEIGAFAGARDVAVAGDRACAVLANGTVLCQGNGALGDGQGNGVIRSATLPFTSAREIEMGSFGFATCVRSSDGAISCWGNNSFGSLGVGFDSMGPLLTPANVVGFTGGGTPPPVLAEVAPLDPGRVLDTRPNGETVDGRNEASGRVPAGGEVVLSVLGRGDVPASDVAAVVLNVTAINPSGRGFVTAYPCGDRPTASSLNYPGAGGVIANELIAKVSAAGTVCLYTSAETHLAADVVGFLPTSSELASLEPARLLDTRPTGMTVDDDFEGDGPVPGDSFIEVQITGRPEVPSSGVSAAILNVTAINPSGRGFVTAYPCGDRPTASSLNYAGAGGVIANELIAKLSATGTICLYTSVQTHLAADIVGYLPTTSSVVSFDPARLLDTRPTGMTVDDEFEATGRVAADTEVELEVTGRGNVPASGVAAVVINVTAINPAARGFVTAYPCGSRPTASSLNYPGAGGVIANELVAKVSASGTVCLYTSAETHLAADVVGYVPT